MRTRLHSFAPLIAVLLLAVTLTAAMSGAVLARSTFQSPPVLPSDTPVLLPPGAQVTIVVTSTATPTATVFAPQPEIPTPTATQPPTEPAAPPGFLPAPTLTNPDALLPLPSTAQQPLVGPAVPPAEPGPEPTATSEVPSAAELIDNSIVALSYLWMCCGALLLVALALAAVWLARRGRGTRR